MCEIIKLQKLKQNGQLPLRGRIDTQHVAETVDTNDCNSQSIELFLSQETLAMRQLDQSTKEEINNCSLQQLQLSSIGKVVNSETGRYHETVSTCSEILKSIGDNNELYAEFRIKFNNLKNEIMKKVVALQNDVSSNSKIFMTYNGKNKNGTEKRKRQFWEKNSTKTVRK